MIEFLGVLDLCYGRFQVHFSSITFLAWPFLQLFTVNWQFVPLFTVNWPLDPPPLLRNVLGTDYYYYYYHYDYYYYYYYYY